MNTLVTGAALNAGCGSSSSLKDLVRVLNEITDSKKTPRYEPARAARWPVVVFLLVTTLAWVAYFTIRSFSVPQMKALHVVIFSAWTWALSAVWRRLLRRASSVFAEIGVPIAAALFAEAIQAWMPPHNASTAGIVASLAGVALGVLLGPLRPGGVAELTRA